MPDYLGVSVNKGLFRLSLILVALFVSTASYAKGKNNSNSGKPSNPVVTPAPAQPGQGSVPMSNQDFPVGPDKDLTPGDLCDTPTELRYPEKIKYCSRSVESSLKAEIITTYDKELGFHVGSMNRADFKIDHYIPLCAGGANTVENLWPQHKSVFSLTDPMEAKICEKMSAGKLKQADAVELIKKAKNSLGRVPEVMRYLQTLN